VTVDSTIQSAIQIGLPLLLLIFTYFVGSAVERRHFRRIRARERQWQQLPAVTFRSAPESWQVSDSGLVHGSVVVSVDYFKRFLAGLRQFIGGRVKSYEAILDRARREAVLRLKAQAIERGYNAVINVRLETSRMANSRRDGQGIAGLEVLAYGTGVLVRQPPA
jgi:uncharacterized protein YbjQ (UPF0145 family)